jgi:hypothetical protein
MARTINDQFAKITAQLPDLFAALAGSKPFVEKGAAWQMGKAGLYAFFENGCPVHVGRTRNLQGRLRGHISQSHNSASFAFKRTRRALKMDATYKPEGSRAALAKNSVFGPEFQRQIACVKAMQVRFVEVTDPLTQHLLELYACMEWGLPLEEFDTH